MTCYTLRRRSSFPPIPLHHSLNKAKDLRRLLRPPRRWPRSRRAAECGQQFPPSDGDRHTPLPCEVRKGNDTTPRACSLNVRGGQDAGCFGLSLRLQLHTISTASPWRTPPSRPRATPRNRASACGNRRRGVTPGIFLYLRNLAFNSLASPSKSGNATESVMPRVRSSLSIESRQGGSTA